MGGGIRIAETKRSVDPEAMDIMEPKVPKHKSTSITSQLLLIPAGAPTLNQQRVKLLKTHVHGIAGQSAWITRGFCLEELQLEIGRAHV